MTRLVIFVLVWSEKYKNRNDYTFGNENGHNMTQTMYTNAQTRHNAKQTTVIG